MSLAAKAARGAVWTILSAIGGRALGVIGTLIITRFLHPDAIGEVGAATILVMTVNWLTNVGFGQYVIVRSRTEPGPDIVWHANVAVIGLGVIGLGAVALLAEPLAALVSSDEAARYIPGMALALGIRRLSTIPEKLLVRQLKFGMLGVANAVGEATYASVTVGFAATGHGAMSVVYGNLAQYSLMTVLIVSAAGTEWLQRTPLSMQRFRDMFRFGWPLAIESIAHNAARYWDNLMVRRLFGAHETGVYNLAYNLADIPAVYIGEQIGTVLLPSLAQMEPARRPRALERATALLSLIIFPLAVGLGAVSKSLVDLALSDEWQDVAPLLTILSVLSVVRPIAWVVSSYLQTQERNRPLMFLEMGKIIVLLGSMVLLSPLGLHATAAAVGIAYGLHAIAQVWLVLRDGPRPAVLLAGFLRPLLASGVMAAAVLAVRFGLAAQLDPHPAIGLTLEVLVGAVVYVPVALLVCRDTAKDLLGLVKDVVKRRRG